MTTRRAVCQLCLAVAGSIPASAHHAGGVGNALGAGPIVTISADTLDQDHSVAGVSLNYQSLGGLSTETLLSTTAAMPPGSPESNNVHDLRTVQAYAISYAYGLTNDFTVAVTLPYVRRTGIREAVEQDNGELAVERLTSPPRSARRSLTSAACAGAAAEHKSKGASGLHLEAGVPIRGGLVRQGVMSGRSRSQSNGKQNLPR